MGDEISEHSITFCWVRFAVKMPPASNTYCTEYYRFKRMKEEQGLLIRQKKNIWMQQGLNPNSLQGESQAPKPSLNHEDSYILRASFFHLAELATSEF
jgi:hypothetical protein